MRERLEFTPEDWLTETQIQGFFTRTAAKKRYDTEKPSEAEVDTTANDMNAIDHAALANHIQQSLEEGVTSNDSCPIISEGVNLCVLAESLITSKTWQQSKLGQLDQKTLKKPLNSLNITEFDGGKATKKRMAAKICDYVKTQCYCITAVTGE